MLSVKILFVVQMENDAEKCFYNYQDNAVETRPNNDKRGENRKSING